MMNPKPEFQRLRDEWALKAPLPSDHEMQMEQQRDRQANPHNDPYHNKKPLRDRSTVIGDLAYNFADQILENQYGSYYRDWLRTAGYSEKWGTFKKEH